MVQKSTKNVVQEKANQFASNKNVQEFYILEKLYQVMREDKKRGKRPSSKELYLMEKLYQAMVNDKNRNKELFES